MQLKRLAIAALFTGLAAPAFADADQQTPTFYFHATGGYSVYKSELVQSNDTSTTVGYGLGIWAGSERNLGMGLRREASSFTFELNASTIKMEWQDIPIRYRFGPVYAGVVLASSSWLVSRPPDNDADGTLDPDTTPEAFLDITSSGYGVNFGATLPVGKAGYAYLDVVSASAGTVREKVLAPETGADAGVLTEKTVTMGSRMELDLGGSIALTKNVLDALVGFKYRTYGLSVDGTAYTEQLNSTYVGLSAGWQF